MDLAPARSGPLPELVGRRALVVDDNATNRQILVAQIARWGMAPARPASPLEALGWLEAGERSTWRCIDLLMPEMDGYALAERIRATTAGAGVPDRGPVVGRNRDREAPAIAAFLTKPVKPSALHDAVVTVLHGDGRAPSVRTSERPTVDPELGRAAPAADPPGRGQRGQPEAGHPAPRPDGLHGRRRRERPGGDRRPRAERLRRRPHGRPDARARRPRGHSTDPGRGPGPAGMSGSWR